ncbi:MAG: hypothetical protein ACYTFY_15305, partial [Planctomycetota bacterium]
SPGVYLLYSANSTDEPKSGDLCNPCNSPSTGFREEILIPRSLSAYADGRYLQDSPVEFVFELDFILSNGI